MRRRGRPPYPDILTPREWEVLALLREGLSNEEIAQRLEFTLAGAKYHVSEILGKLGVATREEAAAWQPTQRPWWLSAAAPIAALWSKARLGWLPGLAAGVVVVPLAMGLGLLVWGLLRTSGEESQPSAVVPATTPGLTVPRPLSPPLVVTPDPRRGTLQLLDPTTGDVRPLNASGSFSPDGRFLATSSLDSHGVDVLNIATAERVRVFDQPGNWVWSPDSSQLAISVSESFFAEGSYPKLNEGVFVANADGSGYREIADLRAAIVSWSPRGDYIAAIVPEMAQAGTPRPPGQWRLLLLGPDGRQQRTLLEGAAGLTWSPSGAELAFLRTEPGAGNSSLMAVDVGSGSVRTIAEDVRLAGDIRLFGGLEWSPDGGAIVLTTADPEQADPVYSDSTFEVFIVMADGSAPPHRVGNGRSPSWSPDGRYLAFVGNWCQPPDQPRFDLTVYDRETQRLETITPLNFDILLAEWSPTDDVIGFLRFDDAGIYTVRPDGSALRPLTSLDSVSDEFLWTPDGGRLAYFTPGGFGICD